MDLLVRRCGTMIDLSLDGQAPLPLEIAQLLTPHMCYDYKRLLRGADAYDPVNGYREGISIEQRKLYGCEQGRLTTGYGFMSLIYQVLSRAGHRLFYLDLSPPRERPNCYEPDWAAVSQAMVYRPRQEECVQAIVNSEGGIINAPTGFGKTWLFMALALLYPHARIHIVVKPKDVAARIVRQLTRVLPLVGQVGGGKRMTGRVTVYTADSLHLSDGDCDLLFCDEAHLLMAESYSRELAQIYRFSRNFAFTATPGGRLDGAHARLQMFFGSQIFYLSYQEAVELGLVCPIRVTWLPIRSTINPAANKTGTPRLRWGIWRNDERNSIIATHARQHRPDEQVLILCATIDHAVHLWQYLQEFDLCYSDIDPTDLAQYQRSRLLPPSFISMSPQRRNEMRTAFEQGVLKRVIATDVWATGVDFEQLQVLYRVDARESEILDTQAPGRVSRVYEGKAYGEVIDCYDAFDKSLKRKSEARRRHYREKGWEQDWPARGRRQISHDA